MKNYIIVEDWIKDIAIACSIVLITILFLMPHQVYANSSWGWISEKRPFDILPWVAAATILIEAIAAGLIPKTDIERRPYVIKTFVIVILANLFSFVAPYLIMYASMSWYGSFDRVLDAAPNYMVGLAYLALTVLVELPLLYVFLGKHVSDKNRFLAIIITTNTVTTIMTAIVERVICEGSWA